MDKKQASSKYNRNCPAVKRLLREALELAEPTADYSAHPLEDNLFEWHFSIRGPLDSEFEAGIYHGRIIFPTEYPMSPPAFSFLTPNGRFATGEKICLSISNYHPETWLPSWSIRTALVAIISFMTTSGGVGNVGELNYPVQDRKVLAKRSLTWECPTCGRNGLPQRDGDRDQGQKEIPDMDANQNVIGAETVQESALPATDVTGLDSSTEGQEIVEIVGIEERVEAESIMESSEGQEGQSEGQRSAQEIQENNPEVDLASVVHQATGSRYVDFGIGAVVAVVLGLFIRRLFTLYPNLVFGFI